MGFPSGKSGVPHLGPDVKQNPGGGTMSKRDSPSLRGAKLRQEDTGSLYISQHAKHVLCMPFDPLELSSEATTLL